MGQARMKRILRDPFEEPLPVKDMLAVYETFFCESDGGTHQTWDSIVRNLDDNALGTAGSLVRRLNYALEALRDIGLLLSTDLPRQTASITIYSTTNNIRMAMQLVKEAYGARDS